MQCIFLLLLTLQLSHSLTTLEQYGYALLGSQVGWFAVFLNSAILEKELLNGLHELSAFTPWQMLLLLWGVCLLGGILGFIFSRKKMSLRLLAFILLSGLSLIQSILFYAWQWPVVLFLLALCGTAGIAFIYFSYLSALQQKYLAQLFYPQLSENQLKHIERQQTQDQWLAQRLTATILFVQLYDLKKNFDTLDPTLLMELLNDYNMIVVNIVARYEGQVLRCAANTLIVAFGVPIASDSAEQIACDARRAVDCALAMRRDLEAWRQQAIMQGMSAARVRMGVYTGALTTGLLSDGQKSHYAILGDTINVAMHISDFNPQLDGQSGYRIFIGDTTLTLLANYYETQYVGTMSVNNKREMNIHRVTGRILLFNSI
ncbi:adenylate/guanylate cyclase domain-containing protein [Thioflexithrix psekupsensis]|nr:adenylate/guanylate cyclase domain-containing protein [Thioflexithrix psekupsensis]